MSNIRTYRHEHIFGATRSIPGASPRHLTRWMVGPVVVVVVVVPVVVAACVLITVAVVCVVVA